MVSGEPLFMFGQHPARALDFLKHKTVTKLDFKDFRERTALEHADLLRQMELD